ncbi:MAG: hypothetical protein C0445_10035 [Polaromonas sp.]|nr:hypothetical protein [Polaromonas sp.]
MRRYVVVLAFFHAVAWAQYPPFPTAFPDGARVLEPAETRQWLTGKVAHMTYANGAQVRVEYKERYAFLNTGAAADSGTWRVEAGQVCIDWQRFPPGCFDVRAVGDVMYAKRATNGEIVRMELR